jgi:outer membrane receptor for ferrienterochelin and colicins
MVDGHRLNDNVYDGAFIGTEEFLDVDLIDRVEIIRGPSSSIYGNSAFLGVINILTKKGKDLNGLEASGVAGSFDTYHGRLSYGRQLDNGLDFLISGSWHDSAGDRKLYYPEFDTPENNNGVAKNSDEDRARRFFSRLSWGEFTLSGGYSWREKNIPTASFDTLFNDGEEETIDARAFGELKYEHEFAEETRLLARAYYDRYEYYGTYPFNYAAPGDPLDRVVNKDDTIGDWVGTELQLTRTLWNRHTFIVGGEYRENLRQFQHNYDQRPRFDYVNVDQKSRNFGFYGQGEVALRTNLLLNAGVRYDYYETFGSTVNPRAGLIYSPWEPSAFKLLYGRAFRAPSDFELYYYSSDFSSPDDLDPETIDTYELVHEQQLSKTYRLSSSLYRYEIKNLISQQEDTVNDTLFFANVEKVRAHGFEVELEGRHESGLRSQLSYALQRSEDVASGSELSNSPRHLAKLNFMAPLYHENIFGGLELQYTGKVRTFSGQTASDYFVANLTIFSRELVKGLEASVSVYNLFNTGYGHPGAGDHTQDVIRQDGRNFRVKLTYRF